MRRFIYTYIILLILPIVAKAQIGDHRDDLSVGINGGFTMTSVGFSPKVTQSNLPGYTMGLSARYVCEKYFSTICSVYAELNYTQMGWRENIIDLESQPVLNSTTGLYDKYDRKLGYVQLPVFAHLAWGKEEKGFNFFFQIGPQFGYLLNEKTVTNFTLDNGNFSDRANKTCAQDTMAVENKFDYGISAGLGLEFSRPGLGHFLLEGRYYYGLGNIYGSTKRDYFAKSNHAAIEIKLSYLFDLKKTKKQLTNNK